jgi:hypothetical protein
MSIKIHDLPKSDLEQLIPLTDNEASEIHGGLENGTAAALGLVGLTLGAIAAAPAIAVGIAGAAVIASAIGVYEAATK